MRSSQVRHGLSCAVMLVMVAALSACGTTQKMSAESASQLSAEKLAERLSLADKAQKEGRTEEALTELDQAAKVDPASKTPWVRKSQIYFDAHQYGQAITAAQEALQRDTSDLTAKSILAVSGLRVSANALEQLRKVNEVNGSTRTEAESVAKLIRDALGEPILIPAADGASAPASRKPAARRVVRSNTSAPASAGAGSAASASAGTSSSSTVKAVDATKANSTIKSAPTGAGGRTNPFGALQ